MNISFAHPAWLLVALIGVPLLAHLFSRTRPRMRVFPSLKLLREALRRVTRVRRPRDRWLLIVRTLAMAALVGAFLQPWLLSRFGSRSGTAKSIVLIVDVTASMGYADSTRTRVAQATAAAEDVLASLPTGSLANVIWLRARATPELPEPGPNLDYLRQSLRKAVALPEGGDIAGALALAVKELSNSPGERELVVLSDFQRSAWREVNWDIPPGIRVTRLSMGTADGANTGLAGLAVEPATPIAGQPARLVCRVRNFSAEPRRATVFAEAGEGRLTQAVEIAPWSETLAVLPVKFPQEGVAAIRASLAEDRYPGDDTAFGLVDVRGALQVGVAGPPDDATTRVWFRACKALDHVAVHRVDKLDAPGPLDVLFVAAWGGENDAALAALAQRGVAVIVQPREGLPPASLRTLLGLPAVANESAPGAQVRDDGWRLRIAAESHPIFSLFAGGAYDDPGSAHFTRRVAMPASLNGTTLLAYEDGPAALTMLASPHARADHRIFWWNLDLGATDWPNHTGFLTFFGEMLRFLGAAGNGATAHVTEAGLPLHFELGSALDPSAVKLLNERDEPVVLSTTRAAGQINTAAEMLPGNYRWMSGDSVLQRAAVTFPETESDLRRLSVEELQRAGGDVIGAGGQARLGELREGKPLWPWFLATAALFFLLEGVLLRIFPSSLYEAPISADKTQRREVAELV